MKNVETFLEHYGIKGMKKPAPPHKLDRVYRVAAGTAALKENIQKAKKDSVKTATDTVKQFVVDQVQTQIEAQKIVLPDPDEKADLHIGESEAENLLKKYGTMKISDLG